VFDPGRQQKEIKFMARFMLLLQDKVGEFDDVSEADMMKIIQAYSEWSKRLGEKGKLLGGEKLTDEAGKIMTLKGGKPVVTDGPFAEAKEILGGYFMLQAGSYEEACALAQDCPHVTRGGRIEIRQVHEL
jgi:hypothetical protein